MEASQNFSLGSPYLTGARGHRPGCNEQNPVWEDTSAAAGGKEGRVGRPGRARTLKTLGYRQCPAHMFNLSLARHSNSSGADLIPSHNTTPSIVTRHSLLVTRHSSLHTHQSSAISGKDKEQGDAYLPPRDATLACSVSRVNFSLWHACSQLAFVKLSVVMSANPNTQQR